MSIKSKGVGNFFKANDGLRINEERAQQKTPIGLS